jgi:DNA-binding protein HU-beta
VSQDPISNAYPTQGPRFRSAGAQNSLYAPQSEEDELNRSQLVKAVAAHTGQDTRAVDATLKGLTDVITGVTAKGEVITISGFAKFARVERAARMGRNPATGEAIKIKASKKVAFRAAKELKEAI